MFKRLFDIFISGIGLLILLPLLVALTFLVKLSSTGPIFYRATRIGRDGVPFKLYKFRSMLVDANKLGPGITVSGDTRITRIGRYLRRTKLDELAQLFNVLKGDMSLVGPRPEDPRYVALYSQEQKQVLVVRPGITSPASIYYHDEEHLLRQADWENQYIQQVMPAKIAIDLNYVRTRNVMTDLLIIFRTFRSLFSRKV
jgi:lipopolysaccharide/colanic/teichoic acid biosynthesis glycosyltransferase